MTTPLVAPPQFMHVFDARILVDPACEIGATPNGQRRVIAITGGSVEGPKLSGRILPGGADYQVIAADGLTHLHARYVIETADGARVYVENTGLRFGSPEVIDRLRRGLPVDPAPRLFPHRATLRNRSARPCLDDDDAVRRHRQSRARPRGAQLLRAVTAKARLAFAGMLPVR